MNRFVSTIFCINVLSKSNILITALLVAAQFLLDAPPGSV